MEDPTRRPRGCQAKKGYPSGLGHGADPDRAATARSASARCAGAAAVSAESDADLRSAFRQGFAELGYVEGKGSVIEYRYAAGRAERLPALAAELVQSKVDVVVVSATAVFEAKAALAGVPTVFVVADDPVKAGLVASMARPAGQMTGLSSLNIDLDGKRLEILKAALPAVRRVGLLTTLQDLQGNPIEARPVLRRLLVGRLVCTPRQLPAGRYYEFSGTATYGELLAGVVGSLVPPG